MSEPLCTCGHPKSSHTDRIQNCEDTPGCLDSDCWCTEFDPIEEEGANDETV